MRKKTKKKKKRSFPIAAEKKEKKEVIEKVKKDWPEFRGLTDNEVEKKLRSLSSDRMLEIYKVLEKEMNFRIDPVNYRRPRIIKNFLILWRSKIEREKKPEVKDETWKPLTDEVAAKIFKA